MNGHQPLRPSWACAECGRPWPCETARDWIAGEEGITSLRLAMSSFFEIAAHEMPDAEPIALWQRFCGWTHDG